jgi:hypothetical protein
MKYPRSIPAVLGLLAACQLPADVLELKGGKVLNGTYVGGTAGTIRFEVDGAVQVIEKSQALALTFTGAAPATPAVPAAPVAASASAPASAPATTAPAAAVAAPAAAPAQITVPAGTTLLVRLVDPVSSRDNDGKRFTTTLESDLTAGGVVVAKAGTKVYGRVQNAQQARRFTGQSKLDLRLSEIAIGSNLVPLMTSGYKESGAKSVGKTAKGAAAGAAIGAIVEDDQGAGKGAAIGAVASGVKRGETASVSPGTLLEFQLQQPVTVAVAR